MIYQVTWVVAVEADDPVGAVYQAAEEIDLAGPETVTLQVRQEPFDTPSPMWDVQDLDYDGAMTLRRMR